MLRRTGAVILVLVAALWVVMTLGTAPAHDPGGARADAVLEQRGAVQVTAADSTALPERPVVLGPVGQTRTLLRTVVLAAAALVALFVLLGRPVRRPMAAGRISPADGEHHLGFRHRGPPLRLA